MHKYPPTLVFLFALLCLFVVLSHKQKIHEIFHHFSLVYQSLYKDSQYQKLLATVAASAAEQLLMELYGILNNTGKSPPEKCSLLFFHILLYRYTNTMKKKIRIQKKVQGLPPGRRLLCAANLYKDLQISQRRKVQGTRFG